MSDLIYRSSIIFEPPMADRWTEHLRCPMCYRTGRATLSQEDDDHMPVADRAPDGFEVIKTAHGIDFICTACRVRVQP
jgi:hypothetical protein